MTQTVEAGVAFGGQSQLSSKPVDPATELVAKTIIKLAQQGVRDVDTLLKTTLTEFNIGE